MNVKSKNREAAQSHKARCLSQSVGSRRRNGCAKGGKDEQAKNTPFFLPLSFYKFPREYVAQIKGVASPLKAGLCHPATRSGSKA